MVNQEFAQMVVTRVKEVMGADYNVFGSMVAKNNSVQLIGVVIQKNGEVVCPTIYLEEYDGLSVEETAKAIVEEYKSADIPFEYGDVIANMNKEFILKHCKKKLVNTDKNAALLSTVPHDDFLDLSIVYRFIVADTEDGEYSVSITNELVEKFGISNDELKTASDNEKYECMTIEDLIAQYDNVEEHDYSSKADPEMYILTNAGNKNGATVLTQVECFKKLADKMGGNLYILPSSIHEVIVVPENGGNIEFLKKMVFDMNRSHLDPEEILSDSVYRYRRVNGMIEIA